MKFFILGPLEIWTTSDGPVEVTGNKRQCMLGALLLQSGRVTPLERIVDALWGARPPVSAVHNVRTYACDLRKAFASHPDTAGRLVSDRSNYRLRCEPAEIDVLEFERLATAGETASRQGDHETATRLLSAALRIWRGRPLDGLPLQSWMAAKATALADRRLAVLSTLSDSQLADGRPQEAIPRLREAVDEYPLCESIWAQLITALHGAGRTGEALAAFAQASRVLGEELGVKPGPDLRDAHAVLLRDRP